MLCRAGNRMSAQICQSSQCTFGLARPPNGSHPSAAGGRVKPGSGSYPQLGPSFWGLANPAQSKHPDLAILPSFVQSRSADPAGSAQDSHRGISLDPRVGPHGPRFARQSQCRRAAIDHTGRRRHRPAPTSLEDWRGRAQTRSCASVEIADRRTLWSRWAEIAHRTSFEGMNWLPKQGQSIQGGVRE